LDRGDQAVNAMRELRAAAPNEAEVHRVLGDVLHRTGRLAEAEESYRRAIELNPRDARAHYSLGLTLRDQGNVDASITRFKTAVQIDPSLHTAWLALARIHAERGEVEQGLACLEPMLRAGTLTREQARADPTLEPLTQDPQFEELGRPSEAP
ncbi:MAG TPA: tetratricopeptide repeat protein, partial [Phycisphaerae bacterium]|nr:tetratricopeptide repeat protein [Phycisphaerae bacterium]